MKKSASIGLAFVAGLSLVSVFQTAMAEPAWEDDPIVVTATRTEQSAMSVPARVSVIMRADIERSQLRERLELVMADVGSAVRDWGAMRERLGTAIGTYKDTPPPVPVDELAEAVQFLEWIEADNFILLGMREYYFEGGVATGELSHRKGTGLGILADPEVRVLRRGSEFVVITPEIRDFLMKPEPLIVSKANVKSRVHRVTQLDYIGVKRYENGVLKGELRIVGLFTSSAYTQSVFDIPMLRRKANNALRTLGFDPESHSGNALRNIYKRPGADF